MKIYKVTETLYLKYKYAYRMSPYIKEYGSWVYSQLTIDNWKAIQTGSRRLMVSPIITTNIDTKNYLNLIYDLDSNDINENIKIIDKIFKHNMDNFKIFYTGGRGFHLHFKYLISYDPNKIDYKRLKSEIQSTLPSGINLNLIDVETSAKDNPIFIFGKRDKYFSVPIEYKNIKNISSYQINDISDILTYDDYKQIIRELIPIKYIKLKDIFSAIK